MSGTSLDGLDVVIGDFSVFPPRQLAARTLPLGDDLARDLEHLCQPGDDHLDLLGSADRRLGERIAEAVLAVLAELEMGPETVAAIGSHGQTVRHRPGGDTPFTLQIGDAALIAELTGIDTVGDFRRRDVAAGGQGAPLVPAYHAALFRGADDCIVVNIGGIANLSALPADPARPVSGHDTGPGNLLLDHWCRRHRDAQYDADGHWARSGEIDEGLLAILRDDPFYAAPAPKSTGREHYHPDWLDERLRRAARGGANLDPADVQATLTELTAWSIAEGARQTGLRPSRLIVCGGGRHNAHLMARIAASLPAVEVCPSEALGVDGDSLEAMAFAWLARQHLLGLPGNVPEVTGARGPRVLGALHRGQR